MYHPIAETYRVPIVVTGFEPIDILQGVYMCVRQLEEGRAEVENQYTRSARPQGNEIARNLVERVFRVSDRTWRGIGSIPSSGLELQESFRAYDAEQKFHVSGQPVKEAPECISGLILQGARKPHECPAFGTRCTPEHPLGATMVSSEGACAAYYRYRGVRSA
jgi:hydrogenase expression/formation protein HypD